MSDKGKFGETGCARSGLDEGLPSAVYGQSQPELANQTSISDGVDVLGERRGSGGRPRKPCLDEKAEKRREYMRDYQLTWMRNRRFEWLAENGPCQQCGSTRELQVDHKEPGKKIAHRIWSWSTERLAAELAKCQVLCRRCHERKTALEFARLPIEQMVALRREYEAGGISHRKLARKYGVCHQTVGRIVSGQRFGWLTEAR